MILHYRLRFKLVDALPDVHVSFEFLGLLGEEQYGLNPYMEPTTITTCEYIKLAKLN